MQVCSTYWKCVALNHGLCVSIALLDESDKGSRINLKNKNIDIPFAVLDLPNWVVFSLYILIWELQVSCGSSNWFIVPWPWEGTWFLVFLIWPAVSNRDSHRNAIVPGLTDRTVHLRKVATQGGRFIPEYLTTPCQFRGILLVNCFRIISIQRIIRYKGQIKRLQTILFSFLVTFVSWWLGHFLYLLSFSVSKEMGTGKFNS